VIYVCIFNSNLRDQNNILPPRGERERERERERELQWRTSDYQKIYSNLRDQNNILPPRRERENYSERQVISKF
jgi:hypothetical protein